MKFQPIKPKKVSSQIADQIRESILAGDFAPGATVHAKVDGEEIVFA